jgi:hypothetical protein
MRKPFQTDAAGLRRPFMLAPYDCAESSYRPAFATESPREIRADPSRFRACLAGANPHILHMSSMIERFKRCLVPALAVALAIACVDAHARTVWRCLRDGTVSLATAPEPGSLCMAKSLDDNAALLPNLWGQLGTFRGTLYQREQNGEIVYSTRNLPGSTPLQQFVVATPAGSPAHAGLGRIGKPQTAVFRGEFASAAKKTGIDEAWLRAIAHAESDFDAAAVSAKGARGVMQLMPEVIADYGVAEPFSAKQSILAGARHLKALDERYGGDRVLAAAAYNAGVGAVTQYDGIPPYVETREYVAKVGELYARYRRAMGLDPRPLQLRPAP